MSEREVTNEPRCLKNVIIIGICFTLQFTGYGGAASLQSSINTEGGLGTASLAATYAALLASTLFLPAVLIRWLGCKWTLVASLVTYMPYIGAQLWPSFFTLIPTAILLGFGAAPLWCAQGTYLTVLAEVRSKTSGLTIEAQLVKFMSIFYMLFQLNQVTGNLISSLVISSNGNAAALTAVEASMIPEVCGANFLPSTDAAAALLPQPPEKIQMLVGIYLTCMATAALLAAFGLDSIKSYEDERSKEKISRVALLGITSRLFFKRKQLCLVIFLIFMGFQSAFFGVDFTVAYVSCSIGPGTVGYIMLTLGVAGAFWCNVMGYLSKVGRLPVVSAAAMLHILLFIALLVWRPQPAQEYLVYIYAVLWALSDSVWSVQLPAYYGTLFPGQEIAAYANLRLSESVGFIIAYSISPHFRTTTKVCSLLATMVLGLCGYYTVEYIERRPKEVKDLHGIDNAVFCEKL